MRKIGFRTIKTAIAVFITLMIYFVLSLIDSDFAYTWYSPFFASIAAVYSMQSNRSKSFALARIRALGSIVGGLFGMVLIVLYEAYLMDFIVINYGNVVNMFVLFTLTALFIVVLIYLLVRFNVFDLVWVAALTYLSVTISTRNNLPVVPFAFNRILSTIIGVLVTLFINNFKLPRFKNKNILFVSGLDGCLLDGNKELSSFSKYQLTRMLDDGLNFTVSTTRTPASLARIFSHVPLRNNLMIMNGAATYDKHNEQYLDIKFIDKAAQKGIDEYFSMKDRNIFTYTIIDEVLSIYHTVFENEAEAKFYTDRRNNYFKNHIKGKLNETDNVLFYILIDKLEVVNGYKEDLLKLYEDLIHIQIYEYSFFEGYYFMKIYTSKASKLVALEEFLGKNKSEMVISFGSKEYDLEIIEHSDYSFALESAEDVVRRNASKVLAGSNPDDIIKFIRKIYYQKNPKKYLENYINNK